MSHAKELRGLVIVGAGVVAGAVALAFLLLAWLALLGGAASPTRCDPTPAPLASNSVPAALRPMFETAARRYRLGTRGSAILAGLTSVESSFGRNMGPSSAGAVGWTQFMPATWRRYGVDANGDGRRDPYDAADAIFSSARYLRANGAPSDWYQALFAYNHADWYVTEVLRRADQMVSGTSAQPCQEPVDLSLGSVQRIAGKGPLTLIPGSDGMLVDRRILPDVEYLIARYHVAVDAAYATSGHEPGGEHPLGLAVDLVPGRGGTWDDVDRLAHWAEPVQNAPRPPFRWVGYDGDPGHAR